MLNATQTCTKCGVAQPKTAFALNGKERRRPDCKTCRSLAMKKWYAANRERQAARERQRKADNPDVYRERDRDRNRSEHRRALAEIRVARRRSLISASEADSGVTRTNLRRQYGDACFYCGVAMTFSRVPKGTPWPPNLATLEHVYPVSLGGTHTWDNVVLACWTCNCRKKNVVDWYPTPRIT